MAGSRQWASEPFATSQITRRPLWVDTVEKVADEVGKSLNLGF